MKSDLRGQPLCPVCRARFRGSAECSRCGADLRALMLLMAHAYRSRQAARQSLAQGDSQAALAFAQSAEQLCSTADGRILEFVSAALASAVTPA